MRFRIDEMDYEYPARYESLGESASRLFRLDSLRGYEQIIKSFISGRESLIGGLYSERLGWEHKTVSLSGFTAAYKMLDCEN